MPHLISPKPTCPRPIRSRVISAIGLVLLALLLLAAHVRLAHASGLLTHNSWTTVAPMPTPRYGLAAVSGPDGRIYAIGGDDGSSYLNTVEA